MHRVVQEKSMATNVRMGYHAIDHSIVNVYYTTDAGKHLRVVGCSNKWLVADVDHNLKWVDKIEYDTYRDAMNAYP